MKKLIVVKAGVFLLASGLFAQPAVALCEALVGRATGQVSEVIDGQTLVLRSGKTIYLIGLIAPARPLAMADNENWPWDKLARQALTEATIGQNVRIAYGGRKQDRHGRLLAHVFVETGDGEVWVQQDMLRDGLARVISSTGNRACVDLLYRAERLARADNVGIWSDNTFAVRPAFPTQLRPHIGTFQIVEGQVLQAEKVRDRYYLNFGTRWSSDFTVIIEGSALKKFETANISPQFYEKRHIRVRGWLFEDGGPVIEVSHPEQIEVIDENKTEK